MDLSQLYIKKISETLDQQDAREESYYSALENLLVEFAQTTNKKHIHVTVLPKKTDAGNPDFRIWDGKHIIIGYIEAKTPDTKLDDIEDTEQIKRYKSTFKNFILTNFLEFRLYREDILVDYVIITDYSFIRGIKKRLVVENEEKLFKLLEKFLSFSFPSINKSVDLAIELAKRTRFIKDESLSIILKEEENGAQKNILGFYEAFHKYLIRGLTLDDFADLYSQTITFGLFASRMRCEGEFNRKVAVYDIPETIGILKDIFRYISSVDLPAQLEWIVDDICEVLKNVDNKIFSNYTNEDPIYHFYETFLAEYNPEERERRGVYYTPNQVVSYIVRSLDLILKEKMLLEDGLANENVTVLDPAGGTLTFLSEVIKKSIINFVSKYGSGGKDEFIKEHILKDFYAFELMVAPYTIGHLKITYLLEDMGHKLQKDERIKYYLTNTLELEDIEQTALPGMASLAEESRKAGEIKKSIPILVILGNPPYSGISSNIGGWITGLIEDYKYVDGIHFGEIKHWLQDDYVKFIRFAEWKMKDEKKGLIGYITNHSYIDNITFRGMRQHLLNSFKYIYVLNLHGSSLKREKSPDGSKDENVFDIQQGVSIVFLIKDDDLTKKQEIFYSDIWGSREKKYEWLKSNDINSTEWTEIFPSSPNYFFIPRDETFGEEYNKFWKITNIFSNNVTGVITARDKFVIDFNEKTLKERIQNFRNLEVSDEEIGKIYSLNDTRGWKVSEARKILNKDPEWETYFKPYFYRPFDIRHIYYTQKMVDWPRPELMPNMLKENLGIYTCRQLSSNKWEHVLITKGLTDDCYVSNKTKERGYIFPLYIYKNNVKLSNINDVLLKLLNEYYNEECSLEEIFNYIYAILHSNIYRLKYIEFLKIDFPKVPFPLNYDLFIKISQYGKRLIKIHLLEGEEFNNTISKFQGEGDNVIKKPQYEISESKLYINKNQYFDSIKDELWNHKIGSYQILEKWIKDRIGRQLSLEEIKIYCKIITMIKISMDIQYEIDKLYPDVELQNIKFKENNAKKLEIFFG